MWATLALNGLNQDQELARMQHESNCVKHNSLSSEKIFLHILQGQLKHSYNFISLLNRVNDRYDLRFSGLRFYCWLAL